MPVTSNASRRPDPGTDDEPIVAPTRRSTSGDPALAVLDVHRRFDAQGSASALDGATFEVPEGSLTAVLGPSGCGKTTLLRVIAGTEVVDSGSIRIHGRVVARSEAGERRVHEPPERRRVGLVPQDGALFPHLDVAANVAFGLHRLDRRERTRRVEEMLALVELEGYGSRRPDELSGGERQRVALARALAPHPEIVLLDEPFSALDAALRAALRDEVADLLRRAGTTAVIVTHDRTEAMSIADHLAVMRRGRLVQCGTPDELYRHPGDPWVARFLGEATLLRGRVGGTGTTASCALGEVGIATTTGTATSGTASSGTVMVRPEQVARVEDGASSTGAASGVATRVTGVRFLGPDVAVELEVPSPRGAGPTDPVAVSALWPSSVGASVGDRVVVRVEGPAVWFPDHPSAARSLQHDAS